MKSFAVRVTSEVRSEIRAVALFIAADSIERALDWEQRVTGAIALLAHTRGFAVDELATAKYGFEVRRYVFERTYLILYRVDETAGVVEVFDFRHGARQP